MATELVANGSLIADALALGAAPTAIDSASVSMDGVEILSSDVATTQTLNVDVPGNHSLVQTIGDVSLAANYIVEGCEDDGVVVASAMTDLATCADGVCDAVPLGNALFGDDEVPVLVNGAPLEASEVSNGVWRPSIPGNYMFTCRVGDVEMSVNYVVNGWAVSEDVVVSSAMADVVVAADGDDVEGLLQIGYAPCETTNAVVAVNGEEIVNSDVEGTLTWRPTESGDYTLTHTVGDVVLSATYHVTLPQIEVDDGTGGIGGADSRFSYAGTYDGEGHGISVVVPEGVVDATVKYARDKDGSYVAENPLFTNACEAATVWYTISAPGYVTYTHSATVAIAKRPVTITSGTKTDFVYDGNPHGIPLIIISGMGFVAGEGITTSNWATVTTVAQGEVANTFDYAAAEGTDLANYDITTSFGTLAVTKRKIVAENSDGAVDSSSASTYNGYLYDDEETPVGTIQAKVAKAKTNRKTGVMSSSVTVAILIAGEKKISLRGTVSDDGEAVSLVAKDGRVLKFWLGANGLSGTFGDYVIDGARDVFSSKAVGDKARANEALAQWKGALAIASDVGTFSVTISAKGKVRITGVLADGTKISTSAQMIVGETCSCIPVVVSTKSVNFAFCIWLGDDGETVEVVGLGEEVVCGRPGALADGAAFRIDATALCELLGDDTFAAYLPDGVSVAQKGTKWIGGFVHKCGSFRARREPFLLTPRLAKGSR